MKKIKWLYILTVAAAMLIGVGLAHAQDYDFGGDPAGPIAGELASEHTAGVEPITPCDRCKTLNQAITLTDETRWRPEYQGPDGGETGSQ